jgi:hypothetical protein
MSKEKHYFILRVQKLIDIVIAPTQDPFSNYELARSGESALSRAIKKWEYNGCDDFIETTIHLPSAKLNDIDTLDASKKFTNYLEGQLQDNSEELYLFKKNLIRIFRNALGILALFLGLATLFSSPDITPGLPQLFRKTLTEGFTIIGWVVLWKPIELSINQLGQLKRTNHLYKKLLSRPIKFIADDTIE